MNGRREPKKSETIEVRLPHHVKTALMVKAHAEGKSASDVIRTSIDSYLAEQPKESRSMLSAMWKPAAAIGAGSLAIVWAAIAPVPSHAKPDLKSVFQILDRNHDGSIAMDEFVRDASDPAVEKMHHAHTQGDKSQLSAAHKQMMQTAHGKPSDQALRSHFAQLDRNGDGSVTFAEFQAFHDKMEAAHGSR